MFWREKNKFWRESCQNKVKAKDKNVLRPNKPQSLMFIQRQRKERRGGTKTKHLLSQTLNNKNRNNKVVYDHSQPRGGPARQPRLGGMAKREHTALHGEYAATEKALFIGGGVVGSKSCCLQVVSYTPCLSSPCQWFDGCNRLVKGSKDAS